MSAKPRPVPPPTKGDELGEAVDYFDDPKARAVTEQEGEMTMSEQKPTVGRIVHYQSFGTPGGEFKSVARAAVVTDVHADNEVTVCVRHLLQQGQVQRRPHARLLELAAEVVMDPRTGQIIEVENEGDARKKGLIPIPADELGSVRVMNRKQRRAWAAQQRKRTSVLPSDRQGGG